MVVDNQQYCLRWNNHQSTLISVLDSLLENAILVDCTLAAEGKYLKAHKVVLCACSPYLQSLLSEHNEKHPIIILKDVKFTELKAMMDYMYRGEVNISEDQLGPFLKTAESLQIKGLSDNAGGSCASGNNSGTFGGTTDHALKSTSSHSHRKSDVQPKRTIYGMLFQPKSPTPTPVTNLSNLTIEPSHKVIVSNSTCVAGVENYELGGETSPNIKRRKLNVRSPKLVIDTEMAPQELAPSSVGVPVIINPDSADRGVPVMSISQTGTVSQEDAQATMPSYTSELFEYGHQSDATSPHNQYDSKSEGGYNDNGGDDNDNGLDYTADDDDDMEGYESSVGNVGDADANIGLSNWQLSEQSDDSAYLPSASSTPSSQGLLRVRTDIPSLNPLHFQKLASYYYCSGKGSGPLVGGDPNCAQDYSMASNYAVTNRPTSVIKSTPPPMSSSSSVVQSYHHHSPEPIASVIRSYEIAQSGTSVIKSCESFSGTTVITSHESAIPVSTVISPYESPLPVTTVITPYDSSFDYSSDTSVVSGDPNAELCYDSAGRIVRKHNKDKEPNFSCEDCGKRYRSKTSLSLHKRLECGKEPAFQCPFCPLKTHQKGNLQVHIKKKHSDSNFFVGHQMC